MGTLGATTPGKSPDPGNNRNPGDGNPGEQWGGGSVGGYGGGYGGGSSGPSDEQKKAADNLGGLVGYNRDTILGKYEQADDTFDLADTQNRYLRDNNILLARQNAGSEWFQQHLKLQSTASAINDRSGNSMRGSGLYDYRDLLGRADDMIDAKTLDTQRQNVNAALQSFFESYAQNNVNRQENAMDTESALRELYADYVAQLNNIHPDLAKDKINKGGHTLNPTDWLKTDWFDSHRRDPVKPDRQSFYRPDKANESAWSAKLKPSGYNTASSVSGDYWQRMNAGYDQRPRQA